MEESIRRTIAIQQEIIREAKQKDSIANLMMSFALEDAAEQDNKENKSANKMVGQADQADSSDDDQQINSKKEAGGSRTFNKPVSDTNEFVRPRELTEEERDKIKARI